MMTSCHRFIATWVVNTYWMIVLEKCKNTSKKFGFEGVVAYINYYSY